MGLAQLPLRAAIDGDSRQQIAAVEQITAADKPQPLSDASRQQTPAANPCEFPMLICSGAYRDGRPGRSCQGAARGLVYRGQVRIL